MNRYQEGCEAVRWSIDGAGKAVTTMCKQPCSLSVSTSQLMAVGR
jgi:hypothetical protein